jgi:hypothetical protein
MQFSTNLDRRLDRFGRVLKFMEGKGQSTNPTSSGFSEILLRAAFEATAPPDKSHSAQRYEKLKAAEHGRAPAEEPAAVSWCAGDSPAPS